MDLKGERELMSFFVFDTQYCIIPTFHQSIGLLFPLVFQLGVGVFQTEISERGGLRASHGTRNCQICKA